MDTATASTEDSSRECPYPQRSCTCCGVSYWADRFDLCPSCDHEHLVRNCGPRYAAHARRVRDQAQLLLASRAAPALPPTAPPEVAPCAT